MPLVAFESEDDFNRMARAVRNQEGDIRSVPAGPLLIADAIQKLQGRDITVYIDNAAEPDADGWQMGRIHMRHIEAIPNSTLDAIDHNEDSGWVYNDTYESDPELEPLRVKIQGREKLRLKPFRQYLGKVYGTKDAYPAVIVDEKHWDNLTLETPAVRYVNKLYFGGSFTPPVYGTTGDLGFWQLTFPNVGWYLLNWTFEGLLSPVLGQTWRLGAYFSNDPAFPMGSASPMSSIIPLATGFGYRVEDYGFVGNITIPLLCDSAPAGLILAIAQLTTPAGISSVSFNEYGQSPSLISMAQN